MSPQRPWPPIEEMRAVCQPPAIRGRRNAEHWTAALFGRSFSIYLTRVAVWLGLSANAVTVIMILVGWAAAAALLIPSVWGAVLACTLAVLQMTIDSIDGEVARWNRTTGPRGIFLDRVAHTTAESGVPLMLGLGLTLAASPDDWRWSALGGAAATFVLINKSFRDGIGMARVQAGLALPRDVADGRAPRQGALRVLRRAADFVPIHRMYHSVEQTMLILVLSVAGVVAGFDGRLVSLVVLAAAIPLVVAGHLTTILNSSLLRRPPS